MVKLVFVHGVSTRSSPTYDQEETNRDQLISSVLFAGVPLAITSPRWGDHVPPLARGGLSFPKTGAAIASLSLTAGLGAQPAAAEGAGDVIANVANTDAATALDTLFVGVVEQAEQAGRSLSQEELSQFRAAVALFEGAKGADTLAGAQTDAEFVQRFRAAAGDAKAYGLMDSLKGAATFVADQARNAASTGLSAMFRDKLNPLVAQFLGDVFVYLKPGSLRNDIRATVISQVIDAHTAARKAGEPLVLIGHSLGGVILYDILSSPAAAGLPAGFSVDALVTVGSQPGLFQEMNLFDFKPPNPKASVDGPGNVKTWVNVLDPIDLFGFRAQPIFGKASDFEFDSGTGLLSSHTTYFKRPQFHARLRERLKAAGIFA